MSSQRGNVKRSRPSKFKNDTAFNNTLHDTSKLTAELNKLRVEDVCARCREIIEWKIKYKKYKPISQPRKCLKCDQKTVKRSYYTICQPCSLSLNVCGKCGQAGVENEGGDAENSSAVCESQDQINRRFETGLTELRERERRTLIRLAATCQNAKSSSPGQERRRIVDVNDDDHHRENKTSDSDDTYSESEQD